MAIDGVGANSNVRSPCSTRSATTGVLKIASYPSSTVRVNRTTARRSGRSMHGKIRRVPVAAAWEATIRLEPNLDQ